MEGLDGGWFLAAVAAVPLLSRLRTLALCWDICRQDCMAGLRGLALLANVDDPPPWNWRMFLDVIVVVLNSKRPDFWAQGAGRCAAAGGILMPTDGGGGGRYSRLANATALARCEKGTNSAVSRPSPFRTRDPPFMRWRRWAA